MPRKEGLISALDFVQELLLRMKSFAVALTPFVSESLLEAADLGARLGACQALIMLKGRAAPAARRRSRSGADSLASHVSISETRTIPEAPGPARDIGL